VGLQHCVVKAVGYLRHQNPAGGILLQIPASASRGHHRDDDGGHFDTHELQNVAGDSQHAALVKRLRALLRAGPQAGGVAGGGGVGEGDGDDNGDSDGGGGDGEAAARARVS